MRIISIANQKGGCGKTTTTINLAASLSANGKKTLVIDLDPQAHASLGLNFENQDSIYNVISKLTPRKLKIVDIIKPVPDGFDIAPSNILVGTLEQELADEIGRELKLVEILATLKGRYDYILIDCPPSLGFLTINAIRASDEVYMPVEMSRFSMQGVAHLLDIIHLIRDRLNHPVQHKILVTMFDSRLRHSFSMLSKIREDFADVLFNTIIHVNVKLKESAVMGQTVVAYDKYCRGTKDYASLAKEIISGVAHASADNAAVADKVSSAAMAAEAAKAASAAKAAGADKAAAAEVVAAAEAVVAAQAPAEMTAAQAEAQPAFSSRMQNLIREESQAILRDMTFALKAPEAQSVYVTGSFNDWSLEEGCRMRLEGDQWVARVPLKPGLYKYQFIVDGRWREDPANSSQERNSFGDINSLVEVQ
jgi:chromosome partitioning protein